MTDAIDNSFNTYAVEIEKRIREDYIVINRIDEGRPTHGDSETTK